MLFRSILTFIDGQSDQEPAHYPETARDRYRGIIYEALDTIINSITERFTQPSFVAYEQMEGLLLNKLKVLMCLKKKNIYESITIKM